MVARRRGAQDSAGMSRCGSAAVGGYRARPLTIGVQARPRPVAEQTFVEAVLRRDVVGDFSGSSS